MLTVTSTPQTLEKILQANLNLHSIFEKGSRIGNNGITIKNIGSNPLKVVVGDINSLATKVTTNTEGVNVTVPASATDFTDGITLAPNFTISFKGQNTLSIILSSALGTTIEAIHAESVISESPSSTPAPSAPQLVELGNVYRDPATAPTFVYYTRALKSDGSIVWIDATGAEVTPPAGLQPVNDDASKVIVNECRVAVANGTGYAIGDRLQNTIIYNHRDAISTVLWFNLTAGTQIATPLTADTEPCPVVSTPVLQDYPVRIIIPSATSLSFVTADQWKSISFLVIGSNSTIDTLHNGASTILLDGETGSFVATGNKYLDQEIRFNTGPTDMIIINAIKAN